MTFLFWKVIFFIDFHFTHKVMKYRFLQFVHSFHHPIFRNFASCAWQVISHSKVSSWIPKQEAAPTSTVTRCSQVVLWWCAICTNQMDLTWSSILSVPSKTIFWKCSCLSWAREAVKYKLSGICLYMYAHNSQMVQFLPCGVTLVRFKFWCSSLFSFTELTLAGNNVILNRSMLPALPPTKPLTCLGRSSRKGRMWWQWQNVKCLHYRSRKC